MDQLMSSSPSTTSITGLYATARHDLTWSNAILRATGIDALEWAERMEAYGAGEFLVTSMDRDGTKIGYDNELNRAISSRARVPLIASGGAGDLGHLYDGFVEGGADAVLAASIFHYRQYTIGEAKAYLAERGVPVRIVEER